jgi:predicted enzyme related to lactoylglutathione lyase
MSRVIHFDINADDVDRAIRFYESVFGWKFEKWEGPMEYWMIKTGNKEEPGIDGGMSRRADTNSGVVNTIGVESGDDAVENIIKAGGKVIQPKNAIPGVGWFASCVDTEGTPFGLMQDNPNAK